MSTRVNHTLLRSAGLAISAFLCAWAPAQNGAAGQQPVRAAIEGVLRNLDRLFADGDVDGYLDVFAPEHPGAHAMLGMHLRRLLAMGSNPQRTSTLLDTPRTLTLADPGQTSGQTSGQTAGQTSGQTAGQTAGQKQPSSGEAPGKRSGAGGTRIVAVVEHAVTFASVPGAAGAKQAAKVLHEQVAIAFRVDDGGVVVPTFTVELPPSKMAGQARHVGDAFRCPPCNYELGGVAGWICVPMRSDRAQALEGATFYLLGTDFSCDVSVRIADHEASAMSTIRALGDGLRKLDPNSHVGVSTPWLPAAYAARTDITPTTGGTPTDLQGAQLQARSSDGSRAIFYVAQFGGLQHVLLARCSDATWQSYAGALDRLLASYRLLDSDCVAAGAAATSLRAHTGGDLKDGRYTNTTYGLTLAGPDGWRAEQRCGGVAFRVVWTSPAGSRLWLVGYRVPTGLPQWCEATADLWLEKLCDGAGLQCASTPKPTWQLDAALSESTQTYARLLHCLPKGIGDPTQPRQRLLRAVMRADLLVVMDAHAAVADERAVLEQTLHGLATQR